MKLTNKKGVTLLELIIVFVIIAIGAVLMVPNMGAWLPNYRLRSATRDVVSMMRTAQMKAVSTNLHYRVNLDDADAEVGANSYVLQCSTAGVWVKNGEVQRLPKGITINGNSLPGKHAQFNPNSTSSSGSITLQNTKGTQKTITLTDSTGRVKIN